MSVAHVRVGKRGVIVIPKPIREKLGIREGSVLEMEVVDDKIILKTRDLWSELRERGKRLRRVNLDEIRKEITEDEELWLKRLMQ